MKPVADMTDVEIVKEWHRASSSARDIFEVGIRKPTMTKVQSETLIASTNRAREMFAEASARRNVYNCHTCGYHGPHAEDFSDVERDDCCVCN